VYVIVWKASKNQSSVSYCGFPLIYPKGLFMGQRLPVPGIPSNCNHVAGMFVWDMVLFLAGLVHVARTSFRHWVLLCLIFPQDGFTACSCARWRQ
jgi:hypothetical protein